MPSINELCDSIARITGEDVSRVRAVARTLINNGLLPKSRGRSIPEANALSASRLLLGIYVSNVPAGAAAAVLTYAALKHQGSKASTVSSKGRQAQSEIEPDCLLALAGEMLNAADERLEFVEICLSWPEVLFKFKKGAEERFLQPWVDPSYQHQDRPKKVVIIPGITIERINFEVFLQSEPELPEEPPR